MNYLNKNNVLNKHWRYSQIERTINNRIYCGDFIVHKGQQNEVIYEDVVEGLISREMWLDCQNQKGKNSRNYTRGIAYLFLQKVHCPKCHSLIASRSPGGKKKDDYVYYRCHNCKMYINENEIINQIKNIMEKLNSDNIITENSLDLDDINLYRDIHKIKQIKINEYYKDQIMLWISWSKEKQQELFMKYIESIELEINNGKIEVKLKLEE